MIIILKDTMEAMSCQWENLQKRNNLKRHNKSIENSSHTAVTPIQEFAHSALASVVITDKLLRFNADCIRVPYKPCNLYIHTFVVVFLKISTIQN
jgi:hypothetical protein